MASINVLSETFEIYLKTANDYFEKKQFILAKKYYLLAAEQMFKIAKESPAALKGVKYERGKSLLKIADSINVSNSDNGQPDLSDANNVSNMDNNVNIDISLDDAIGELNNLIGLDAVKKEVLRWIDQIKIFKIRKDKGLSTPKMTYHLVFTGNPGTGKTTVARIIGKIYRALNILSKGHLVEVERSDLVAGYVGQTAIKTKEIINKARGGVLFIDEAYSLSSGSGNDFGQEAISILLKNMEDYRDDFVVIVAGYQNEMGNFIESNPGLKSRFKNFINFDDYNGDELLNIFLKLADDNQYILDSNALNSIKVFMEDTYNSRDKDFGNGRFVRNIFERIISNQASRVSKMDSPSDEEIMSINIEDLYGIIDVNQTPKKSVKVESQNSKKYLFEWSNIPKVSFDDIAGLEDVKEEVYSKVLLPLKNPKLFEGYEKQSGGGLFLFGPPGTGKTMIAAAIANEIGANFCSIKPSDILGSGQGSSEKMIKKLFEEARSFKTAIIYFDEMDSISPKTTRSQYAKQVRSELLAQIQGVDSYNSSKSNLLFLIASTNYPWDVDSAFLRPGRFGTRIYIGLPDAAARKYILKRKMKTIKKKGIVKFSDDIDFNSIVERTENYNCADVAYLFDKAVEFSILRAKESGVKEIINDDFNSALNVVKSSVHSEDIQKYLEWMKG